MDELVKIEGKKRQNESEDALFRKQLDKYFSGSMPSHEVINVCSTPNILKLMGSAARKVVINQNELENSISSSKSRNKNHTNGHEIEKDELYKLSEAIRSPIVVLRGNKKNENSVVLLTDLVNKSGQNVFVPISLDRQNGKISNIATLYGRKNLSDYLKRYSSEILAVNKEKANTFADTEKQFLKSINDTVVRFDNCITYTTANVKGFGEKNNEKSVNFENEENEAMPEIEELLLEKYAEINEQPLDASLSSYKVSEDEQLRIAEKIEQNRREEELFKEQLHRLIEGDKKLASRPLMIGKTPNSLVICGADESYDLQILKSVVDKALKPENRDENGKLVGKTGHGLTEKQLINAIENIKNPVMILRGSKDDSLVAVTEIKDNNNRYVFVTIDLNKKTRYGEVNNITSSYGRDDIGAYFEREFSKGNLLSVNIEKADKVLHAIGKWYPEGNTLISFDNSITYTTANVNGFGEKNNEKSVNFEKEENEAMPEIEEPLLEKYAEINEQPLDASLLSYKVSEDEQLRIAEKIDQNRREEELFKEQLHRLIEGDKKLARRPLVVGQTPNILVVCSKAIGADIEANANLIITKTTIDKAMRPEVRDENGRRTKVSGHFLIEKQILQAVSEIKDPIMILKGSRNNSLVVVTEIKDDKGQQVIVPVELNHSLGANGEVSNITSIYGRSEFEEYLGRSKILAVNIEKAEKLLLAVGKEYPPADTIISFDNSITYTTANVKGFETKNFEKSVNFEKEENEAMLEMNDIVKYGTDGTLYYDSMTIERELPHNMRFKEYNTSLEHDGGIYWVTQEGFDFDDLKKFQNVMKKYDIPKVFITVRDLSSSYDFEKDRKEGVLIKITQKDIDYKKYNETLQNWEYEDESFSYYNYYGIKEEVELKAYERYSTDEWRAEGKGFKAVREAPGVYFDIDGTLGYWYKDGRGLPLEEILNPKNHYFRDIEPHPMMIELAKALHNSGADVCIISAADRDTFRDKWEWIDEHLPFIPKENICFAPLGADKSEFVKGNAEHSILIDDYNKNLAERTGKSIKAINFVNSHQLKYDEIDFTMQEELLKANPTWAAKDFKKEILAARDFVLDEIKVQQNAIRFAKEVDDALAGKASRYNDLKVCDTPQILLDVGCEQLPMLYTQKHLRDAIRPRGTTGESIHHHGLNIEMIKKFLRLWLIQ